MSLLPQIYSVSQWLMIHEDLNFLTTDVQLVEDELLLQTSGRRCFRFLEGSERKSPRLRSKEGNCVILQYLGGRQYLARTVGSIKTTPSSHTNCYSGGDINRRCNRRSRDHFKFLVLDDSLPCPENTEVIFEWTLTSRCERDRAVIQMIETGPPCSRPNFGQCWPNVGGRWPNVGVLAGMESRIVSVPQDTSRTSEVFFGSHQVAHFESYASCRKRFVVIVGPPCLNYTRKQQQEGEGKEEEWKKEEEKKEEGFCQPSNCIFDADDLSMKVFHLNHSCGLTGEPMNRWSANIAFDPRPFREYAAAVIACTDTFNYLPRSGQTGSLVIFDVLRQRVLHARQDRLYLSTVLQYTCTGEQLLTSFSHSDVITSRPPTSSAGEIISSERRTSHLALFSSDDLTLLRLLSLSPTSTLFTPVLSSLLSRDFRNFAMFFCRSNNEVGTSQSPSPIEVVNFSFPAEVGSLFRMCLVVVRKLVPRKEMVDSLPIPKVIASRLKEL